MLFLGKNYKYANDLFLAFYSFNQWNLNISRLQLNKDDIMDPEYCCVLIVVLYITLPSSVIHDGQF